MILTRLWPVWQTTITIQCDLLLLRNCDASAPTLISFFNPTDHLSPIDTVLLHLLLSGYHNQVGMSTPSSPKLPSTSASSSSQSVRNMSTPRCPRPPSTPLLISPNSSKNMLSPRSPHTPATPASSTVFEEESEIFVPILTHVTEGSSVRGVDPSSCIPVWFARGLCENAIRRLVNILNGSSNDKQSASAFTGMVEVISPCVVVPLFGELSCIITDHIYNNSMGALKMSKWRETPTAIVLTSSMVVICMEPSYLWVLVPE